MAAVSDTDRERIREEVAEEFPGDPLMQDIHFIRQLHHLETRDMTPAQRVSFYRKRAPETRDALAGMQQA